MSGTFCYKTSIGLIKITEDGSAITRVDFIKEIGEDKYLIETPLLKEANKQLQEYLNGERKRFDLKLKLQGTEFQQRVWEELQEIPYGETNSYKDIAIKVGNEKASRAIGMANNRNPIPIFIPCHRVIGANGKLVGYAGGLDIKEKLLKIEKENK